MIRVIRLLVNGRTLNGKMQCLCLDKRCAIEAPGRGHGLVGVPIVKEIQNGKMTLAMSRSPL